MAKMLNSEYYMDDDKDVLSIYLKQINKIPMISHEEEYELALKAQQGDKKAREKLINSNLRFVVTVAKKNQEGCAERTAHHLDLPGHRGDKPLGGLSDTYG